MSTTYTVANSFSADTTAVASEVNTNFSDVLIALNAFDASNLASGSVPLARISGLTTTQFASATLVIESEGISSNDNDTTIPTCAAVKDYVDTQDAVADDDAFGTRTDKDSGGSVALAKNEIYKVGSDGFVTFIHGQGNQGILYFYSDSSSTPTTLLGRIQGDMGIGYWSPCFPIKKNDYWKITYAGAGVITDIRWLPIGSGTCVKQ